MAAPPHTYRFPYARTRGFRSSGQAVSPHRYIQFIERAAKSYGKKGKIEAQHLAFELTELFASGELTPQDMDGIMYEMHKAYFKYREQKQEKERIMNL